MACVKPATLLMLALVIVLIPIKWAFAWIVAVIVHELFHILALYILGYDVRGFYIDSMSVNLLTDPLLPKHELICAISGPLGSFLLLLFVRWMPMVALCGFVQGTYNLFPLYPMDGGRVVNTILHRLLNEKNVIMTMCALRIGTYVVVVACAGILCVRLSCIVPLIIVALLIWKDRKNTLQKQN